MKVLWVIVPAVLFASLAVAQQQTDSTSPRYSNPAIAGYSNPAIAGYSNPAIARYSNPAIAGYSNPAIARYGKIVQLPNAARQPRDGSRIVVDIVRGGEPDTLNAAIEKVARFVNIYRGAGRKAASVDIAIVLHGDATLTILKHDVYSERFKTKGNPNLDCLHQLHKAGVEILVCGQSLIGKGSKPEDVVDYSDVAVSALTSLVNLQSDGYAYVPLGK